MSIEIKRYGTCKNVFVDGKFEAIYNNMIPDKDILKDVRLELKKRNKSELNAAYGAKIQSAYTGGVK